MTNDGILYEGDTRFGHYVVADTIYSGRPARVLYSGNHQAAQSGIAKDDRDELLFDYNQRFIELIRGLQPKNVLLIGGGAFTLPKALLKEFPGMSLDIVELDEGLSEIAQKYFDFKPTKRTHMYFEDGRTYLKNTATKYDLILLDVFMHATVPPAMQTVEVAHDLERHLHPEGVVAMNIIASYHGRRSTALRRQVAAFQAVFEKLSMTPATQSLSTWLPQNFILVAQNGSYDVEAYMRHAPLALPKVHDDKL